MSNKIEFVVLGDTKDIEKKLDGTRNSFDKLQKVSAVAFAGLTASAVGFVAAAREQEEATNFLNQALKTQGNYSEETSRDLLTYASALQEVSLFGDEAIIRAQGIIASFGFEGQALKDLTAATLDLAQAKGMDLASAADLVAKSVGGSTNALSRYGIEINGVAGSSLRAQSAIEGINRLYGGQAKAATEGLGSTIQLKNAISDLAEEFGLALAPVVIDVTKQVKSFVDIMKQHPEITKMAAEVFVLGVQIAAAVLAASTFAKVGIAMQVGAQSLALIIPTLSGGIAAVGVALTSVAGIGAAAFVGWKVGELISDITGLSDAVEKLGNKLGEMRAQKDLGSDYISDEDFEEVKRQAAERLAILEDERKKQEEIEQAKADKRREINQFILDSDNELKQISQASSQEDLDNLVTKMEEERQALLNHLQLKAQILSENGVLDLATQEMLKAEELAIKQKYDDLEIQAAQERENKLTLVQQRGKEIADKINKDKLGSLRTTLEQASALNSKFAIAYKAVAIGEAIMSTAAGVTRALKDYPYPASLAVAALVGAAGAVQIATIASQSFAQGTDEIPRDMTANVHKGEIIVPQTFSEAIRNGDLALTGPSANTSAPGQTQIIVDLSGANINGITDDLVEDIFTRAAENMANRTLPPLPA